MKVRFGPLARSAIAAVAAVTLAASTAQARQSTPKMKWTDADLAAAARCVDFMLMGPSHDGITIHGEEYDCKPVSDITVRAGGWLEVTGMVSRELTLRPDDDLKMTISVMPDGRMRTRTVESPGGVLGPFIPDEGGTATRDEPLPANLQTMTSAEIMLSGVIGNPNVNVGDSPGDWEWVGYALARAVGLEMARSQKYRDGRAYFFDRPGKDYRHFELVNGKHYGANDINSGFPRTYVDACASSCDLDGQCRAWTMSRAGNKRICWLKGYGTQPVLDRNAVSGVKAIPKLPPVQMQILKPKSG